MVFDKLLFDLVLDFLPNFSFWGKSFPFLLLFAPSMSHLSQIGYVNTITKQISPSNGNYHYQSKQFYVYFYLNFWSYFFFFFCISNWNSTIPKMLEQSHLNWLSVDVSVPSIWLLLLFCFYLPKINFIICKPLINCKLLSKRLQNLSNSIRFGWFVGSSV